MEVSQGGPIEQLTYYVSLLMAPAFATFPAHDAQGAVLGVPVLSFYAAEPVPWPAVVVRMHPGDSPRSGIGNISEVNNGTGVSASGLQPGETAETILAENAVLELRLGARSEVERERLVDWAYRALHFNVPVDPSSGMSVLQMLGAYGIVVKSIGAPVLAEVDPAAPRPQGVPPWPGQVFASCRAELTVVTGGQIGTVTVVPPTFVTSPAASRQMATVQAQALAGGGTLVWDVGHWDQNAWQ